MANATNEVWVFNTRTLVWTNVDYDCDLNICPSIRQDSAGVVMSGGKWSSLWFIFGGLHNGIPLSDIWLFNFTSCSWTSVISDNTSPSARYSHVVSNFGDHVYVYGGLMDNTNILNDLWIMNVSTLTWSMLSSNLLNQNCRSPSSWQLNSLLLLYCNIETSLLDNSTAVVISEMSVIKAVDLNSISFVNFSAPFIGRHKSSFVVLNNRMYLIGQKFLLFGNIVSADTSGGGVFSSGKDFFPYFDQVENNPSIQSSHICAKLFDKVLFILL